MITKEDVRKIASLARLYISEEELDKFVVQFNRILGYMRELDELSLEGAEANFYVGDFDNRFREDAVEPSMGSKEATSNAPEEEEGFFKTPRIV